MKKINIKKAIVLFCLTIGYVNIAKAQAYSNEWCLFQKVGCDQYWAIKFEGTYAYLGAHDKVQSWGITYNFSWLYDYIIRKGFKNSSHFLEELSNNSDYTVYKLTYDSDLSTSSRSVYKISIEKKSPGNALFIAVDKSLSTIKFWYKAWLTNNVSYKELVRVDSEIFKPKAVNYDFLND